MPKNNFYISFSVWLVILPFLGVPIAWKNILVLLSGLFLLLVSLGPTILKKLQTKPKIKKKKENLEQKTNLSPSLPKSYDGTSNPTYIKEGEEKKEELRFSDENNSPPAPLL